MYYLCIYLLMEVYFIICGECTSILFFLEFYVLQFICESISTLNSSVNLSLQASALLALPVFFLYKLCSAIFWLVDSFLFYFFFHCYWESTGTRGKILKHRLQPVGDLLGWQNYIRYIYSIKSKWIPFLPTGVPIGFAPVRNTLILST